VNVGLSVVAGAVLVYSGVPSLGGEGRVWWCSCLSGVISICGVSLRLLNSLRTVLFAAPDQLRMARGFREVGILI